MKTVLTIAGAFTIAALINTSPAFAADLDGDGYIEGNAGYSMLDGKRYFDRYDDYGYDAYRYGKSYKDYNLYDNYYGRKSYKDAYQDRAGYSYKNYKKRDPKLFRRIPEVRYYDDCLRPRGIYHRLRRLGWYDFHNLKIRNFVFGVKARRDDGQLYRLRVDRCTGDIIRAKPLWNQYRSFRFW